MTPKLGFTFLPTMPPEALPDLARAVDEHLDELWVWEDCFAEGGLSAAAAALALTERAGVGLGIMPTPLRNVALTAMEIATLDRMFPGRFRPGIGHGVQEWMGQAGVRAASPLRLLEEYGVALGALLRGEEVTVDGRYVRLDAIRLAWPPRDPIPLLIGAEGPKTLELAGRIGDGVICTWIDDDGFAAARARSTATHPPERQPLEFVSTLVVATGPGAADRADGELRAWGREPKPDMTATGDPRAIAETIRRRADQGADTIVLQPCRDEPDLLGFIAFLGQQVRPLLAG